MGSKINRTKLIQLIADIFILPELEGFLQDNFNQRLDHIIEPRGVGLIEVVQKVVDYFDDQGNLGDLVGELSLYTHGKIDIMDVLMLGPTVPSRSLPASSSIASSTTVDIDASEIEFYYLLEPDHRLLEFAKEQPPAMETLFVRIPVVSRVTTTASPLPQALVLALDRSGSMAEDKMPLARAAAEYLLDLAQGTTCQVSVQAFDEHIKVIVPLQQIKNASTHKRHLSNIPPRGFTNLFAGWARAVSTLRTLNDSWNRRIVLITDGMLNRGELDPDVFAQRVAEVWKTDHITTTCVSMGAERNADLLAKLALAGGGSSYFIGSTSQANQVMHEIYHSASGVVAHNVGVELEPLNGTKVIRVNDEPRSLSTGQADDFLVTNQLLTNTEDYLVVKLEVPSPKTKKKVAVLQCRIFYQSPVTGQRRKTPAKTLYISGRASQSADAPVIVNQGVICSAHIISSRGLYKKALDAYLIQNEQLGDELLAQAKLVLQTVPTLPKGYETRVAVQEGRIQTLEQDSKKHQYENIKRMYFEEQTHREVIWEKLYQLFDQILAAYQAERSSHKIGDLFQWANRMIAENSSQLPIPVNSSETPFGELLDNQSNLSQQDDLAYQFWRTVNDLSYVFTEESVGSNRRRGGGQQDKKQLNPATIIALLTGACYKLEQLRQGAQEEVEELLASYLESRYKIQIVLE